MRVIGYIKTSPVNFDMEVCKSELLNFANSKNLLPVEWIEEKIPAQLHWKDRELGQIFKELKQGDVIITSQLSKLGRTTIQVIEFLNAARKKEIFVYTIKGNWQIDNSIQSNILPFVLSMVTELEKDIISERAKESIKSALKGGTRTGNPIGRPKGNGKSKLDQYKTEIVGLLNNGSRQTFIANKYGVSAEHLNRWIKKEGLV